MTVLNNYINIKNIVNKISRDITIVAISKKTSLDQIIPLIDYGHFHYGENKVQEATQKWKNIIINHSNLRLHFVGPLQTNKVEEAVNLFSYIHSLDSEKLAIKLNKSEKNSNKKLKYFIQVNIGNEKQKSGIDINNLNNFVKFCNIELNLNIIGLMCLPPINKDPKQYFIKLKELSLINNLKQHSMGMSNDYIEAVKNGATFIRVGSSIFGNRK
jgi:pyridoxal phosphate enzyme (YggS family)